MKSLQNGNMLNDVAIRAYVLLCLSAATKNDTIENTLVLDSPVTSCNRCEYLKQVVVGAHRKRLRIKKFQKVIHVVNIDNWHWYVLVYDSKEQRQQIKSFVPRKSSY